MALQYLKTPFNRSLDKFATRRVYEEIQAGGTALPCSVTAVMWPLVTVNFDVSGIYTLPKLTVPLATSAYRQEPVQVGDKGVVYPSTVSLGGSTGLGPASPNITDVNAAMSNLVFFALGNTNWPAPDDPNSYTIWGPNGVILRTGTHSVQAKLSSAGVVITGGPLTAPTLHAGNGVSGTFTHVTVVDGIVTGGS